MCTKEAAFDDVSFARSAGLWPPVEAILLQQRFSWIALLPITKDLVVVARPTTGVNKEIAKDEEDQGSEKRLVRLGR